MTRKSVWRSQSLRIMWPYYGCCDRLDEQTAVVCVHVWLTAAIPCCVLDYILWHMHACNQSRSVLQWAFVFRYFPLVTVRLSRLLWKLCTIRTFTITGVLNSNNIVAPLVKWQTRRRYLLREQCSCIMNTLLAVALLGLVSPGAATKGVTPIFP